MIDLEKICKDYAGLKEIKDADFSKVFNCLIVEVGLAGKSYCEFKSAIDEEFALGDYVDRYASHLSAIVANCIILAAKEGINLEVALGDYLARARG